MTIKSFDKTNARALGMEIEAALGEIAKKHGVTIEYGGGRLEDIEFTLKLRIKVADPKIAEAAERREFESLAPLYHMPRDAYGKTFMANGTQYKLVSIEPGRSKYPFVGVRADGKRFKFGPTIVRHFA